jgi:hypothetical protein
LQHMDTGMQYLVAMSTSGIDGMVMIVSPGVADAVERRRSLALELVMSQLGCQSKYDFVGRVCSPSDLQAATEATRGPKLLWLDLDDEQLAATLEAASQIWDSGAGTHVILTCADEPDEEALDSVADVIGMFEELEIGAQPEPANVYADDLHTEFKVLSSFKSSTGAPVAARCLLDVWDPTGLAQQLNAVLRHQCGTAASIVGLYRADEANGVYCRLCVSDVGFLHCLRDSMLTGKFGHDLAAALAQPEPRRTSRETGDVSTIEPEPEEEAATPAAESAVVSEITIDKTYFAEMYEQSILNLSKLTPHQREKLRECEDAGSANIHIKAPAGAGKTFVALHYMLQLLQADSNAYILFVAKNRPLALFVSRWLSKRIPNARRRKRLLGRLHLLSAPLQEGPRSISEVNGSLRMAPTTGGSRKYDLVVIDEAHHVFREGGLGSTALVYAPEGTRLILLSDVSQSLRSDVSFPAGLLDVVLTEVVRSSKRIVAAVKTFQGRGNDGDDGNTLKTRCHHQSAGPPLKSFLFDIAEDADLMEAYALHTVLSLQHVAGEFVGLNLHDRVACVVSDASFRERLRPVLQRQLQHAFPERQFKLVTAEDACALVGPTTDGSEWLVLDEIEQLDGLERLIVIAVGLDRPIDDRSVDTLEARSMLYRAMTRAQMLVQVVNVMIPSGWFAFLTTVQLAEGEAYDEAQAQREAEAQHAARMREQQEREAEAKRLGEQADEALAEPGKAEGLDSAARLFVKQQVVVQLRSGRTEDEAVSSALAAWEREARRRALRVAVDDRAAAAELSDRAFVGAVHEAAERHLEAMGESAQVADAADRALAGCARSVAPSVVGS